MFPDSDENEKRVSVSYRAIFGDFKGSLGPKSKGVFATAFAHFGPDVKRVTVTEAAIDALSLATCGVQSFAVNGKDGLPDWFLRRCAFRVVQIAFDADAAGDAAADKLAAVLRSRGATVVRLRPPEPFKDWNEALIAQGKDALTEYLTPFRSFD